MGSSPASGATRRPSGQGAGVQPARRHRRLELPRSAAGDSGISSTPTHRRVVICASIRCSIGPRSTSGAMSSARTSDGATLFRPRRQALPLARREGHHLRRWPATPRRSTDIIAELEIDRTPERAGRAMDHETEDAFERLRGDGVHVMAGARHQPAAGLERCASSSSAMSTTASRRWSAAWCTTPARCPTASWRPSRRCASGAAMPFEWAFLMDAFQSERDQGITIDTAQIWFHRQARLRHHRRAGPSRVPQEHDHRRGQRRCRAAADRRQPRRAAAVAPPWLPAAPSRHPAGRGGGQQDGSGRLFRERVRRDPRSYTRVSLAGLRRRADSSCRSRRATATTWSPRRAMPWYSGPTLLDALELPAGRRPVELPLRLPIQDVYKFDDRRILVGRIESGRLAVGDRLLFSPSNKIARGSTASEAGAAPTPRQAVAGRTPSASRSTSSSSSSAASSPAGRQTRRSRPTSSAAGCSGWARSRCRRRPNTG